jgi:hypothetical protein
MSDHESNDITETAQAVTDSAAMSTPEVAGDAPAGATTQQRQLLLVGGILVLIVVVVVALAIGGVFSSKAALKHVSHPDLIRACIADAKTAEVAVGAYDALQKSPVVREVVGTRLGQ